MIRPCPELAFEVAAEECRLAAERGETVVEALAIDDLRLFAGAVFDLGVATDSDHEWGIDILAWEEDVPCAE
jgi:hypothetical protein